MQTVPAEQQDVNFEVGDFKYIYKVKNNYAKVLGPSTNASKKINWEAEIPKSVPNPIDKKKVDVTCIVNKAFKDCVEIRSVTIPESVRSIGLEAFNGCINLVKIVIPSSIMKLDLSAFSGAKPVSLTTPSAFASRKFFDLTETRDVVIVSGKGIRRSAFDSCKSLETIELPSSLVSIEEGAFAFCTSLTSIIIPKSVTIIKNTVFVGCSSLKYIRVEKDNTNYCDYFGILYNERRTELMCFPLGTIITTFSFPQQVTTIAEGAFYEYSLKKINIPNTITTIGTGAFYGSTKLESISIPPSIKVIHPYTFANCLKLTRVTFENKDVFPDIEKDAFKAINSNCIATYYKNAKSTVKGKSVEEILKDAGFSKLAAIDNPPTPAVKFPESSNTLSSNYDQNEEQTIENIIYELKYDDEKTPYACVTGNTTNTDNIWNANIYKQVDFNSLKGVQVTVIGAYAFANSALESIVIPDSIITIEHAAFNGCSKLASVTIPSSVTSIGSNAFGGCSSLVSVAIPSSVTWIGLGAFEVCSSLASVTIPSSVTSINDGTFLSCSSLASVSIPSSVTSIGSSAFQSCSSLASVAIPSSVTYIGSEAFSGCSLLASVTIPSSVTSIGFSAFSGCSSLASVTIPSSVTSIGESAFQDCSKLATVTIPSSVTSVGYFAFQGCSSLVSVTFESVDSIPTLGENSFADNSNNCTAIYYTSDGNANLTIENSLKGVGFDKVEVNKK
uniref:Uncharacterized protein n=1 Tax=viral metagenome TaxID=1070528 RepID=A0A6C0F6Q2_9ZZZZ